MYTPNLTQTMHLRSYGSIYGWVCWRGILVSKKIFKKVRGACMSAAHFFFLLLVFSSLSSLFSSSSVREAGGVAMGGGRQSGAGLWAERRRAKLILGQLAGSWGGAHPKRTFRSLFVEWYFAQIWFAMEWTEKRASSPLCRPLCHRESTRHTYKSSDIHGSSCKGPIISAGRRQLTYFGWAE